MNIVEFMNCLSNECRNLEIELQELGQLYDRVMGNAMALRLRGRYLRNKLARLSWKVQEVKSKVDSIRLDWGTYMYRSAYKQSLMALDIAISRMLFSLDGLLYDVPQKVSVS